MKTVKSKFLFCWISEYEKNHFFIVLKFCNFFLLLLTSNLSKTFFFHSISYKLRIFLSTKKSLQLEGKKKLKCELNSDAKDYSWDNFSLLKFSSRDMALIVKTQFWNFKSLKIGNNFNSFYFLFSTRPKMGSNFDVFKTRIPVIKVNVFKATWDQKLFFCLFA